MTVLSLFDGICCGRLALKKIGISVDSYYASEIETNAIKVAKRNFPDTIEIGDVCKVSYENGILHSQNGDYNIGHVDLLIGGSPCTNFSSIGYANGMVSGNVEIKDLQQYLELKRLGSVFEGQSYLFWEYARILNEVKPDFFLLENVVMAKKWEAVITKNMGVEPIQINSSLLSAQNRPRLYWTNIPNVMPPMDKNISLENILSSDADESDVFHCLTVQRSFPRMIKKYGYIPERFNAYNASQIKNKGCALSRGSMVTSSCATLIFAKNKNGVHSVKNGVLDGKYKTKLADGKYNIRRLSVLECERLQTLPDNYTAALGVSNQKRNEIIGNGWTVDVIAHIFSFLREENVAWAKNKRFSA